MIPRDHIEQVAAIGEALVASQRTLAAVRLAGYGEDSNLYLDALALHGRIEKAAEWIGSARIVKRGTAGGRKVGAGVMK